MAFTLPELPYAYEALEPVVDAETMRLHHTKHHQAYVDKLNEAARDDPELLDGSLEAILASASSQPKKVRNNAGGHWNHAFFWETMKPAGSKPSGPLAEAINDTFGSLDSLKKEFNDAGVGQFGSGWVWLLADTDGRLRIAATPDQDNPLMDDAPVKGTPILGNDVWEHAYYLRYNNRRAEYLNAWWDVVNWAKAAERFDSQPSKQPHSVG